MIDYQAVKKHLIRTLLDYGFTEKKDKTCRSCRVFSNGSEILLVKQNKQGEYAYYNNKSVTKDYGDVVQFIMTRKFNKSYKLSAEEFKEVEAELERICGLSAIKEVESRHVERPQLFDITKYHVERLDAAAVPGAISRFFGYRMIDETQLEPFKTSMGVLVSEKGFRMPLFYWQNLQGQILGAQNKYIKEGKCEKRFLVGTNRDNSLWMTPTKNRVGLFVAEDPLDAIAHYQLFPTANVAYLCTGGTSTKAQRRMIHNLAQQSNLPIILGNDNDLAGQLENMKIALELRGDFQYSTNVSAQKVTITVNGSAYEFTKEDMCKYLTKRQDITLALPESKDWNDDLRMQKKVDHLITSKLSLLEPPAMQTMPSRQEIKML